MYLLTDKTGTQCRNKALVYMNRSTPYYV